MAPAGNKYERGKPEISEQDTLGEKGTTEVKESESDIHSKLLNNPEIHLPVHFDSEHQHFIRIPEDSMTLGRSSRNRRKPLRYPEH